MRGALVGALLVALVGCAPTTPPTTAPVPAPERATLTRVPFADLPGWADDAVGEALSALERSCVMILRGPDNRPVGPDGVGGTVSDWRRPCTALPAPADARTFFEQHFRPFRVSANAGSTGLFTGYFEPELTGSLTRHSPTATPLYRRPADLVMVELGDWRGDLRGQRVAGRVVDGRLTPYASRAEIDRGALGGQGLELLWLDSAVDAFFLHIQGSGAVRLPDGRTVRVGYAAQNGHAYVPIGRPMVQQGLLPADGVSMQSIRGWLEANPARAASVMQLNPSYIFFRLTPDGPIGAQGVTLTPGRSLAIDPAFIPLGAPIWLDVADDEAPRGRVQRLVIAQDTGGAIRGPVRGDVFWGTGTAAGDRAGRYRQQGGFWLLLPTTVADRRP